MQCFRPVTSSGRPLITRISDEKLGGLKTHGNAEGGVFIAAGHGAWGISHAPGTGLVLSELIEDRPLSAKIDALRYAFTETAVTHINNSAGLPMEPFRTDNW
ncbi:MAG: FAD-binding oxidoreductase [Sphingobacteriales bacterium]|nr:MAG: FAD-binding oxidoreductase [Sphingobacteriales bacterium]